MSPGFSLLPFLFFFLHTYDGQQFLMNQLIEFAHIIRHYFFQLIQLRINQWLQFCIRIFCLLAKPGTTCSGCIINTAELIVKPDRKIQHILAAFSFGLMQGFFHSSKLFIDGIHLLLHFFWHILSYTSVKIIHLLS